jgi:predicted nucleotidyltransferase
MLDHGVTLDALRERDRLTPEYLAVFVSGSVVRGWGNARSDIDVYVVSDRAFEGADATQVVALDPATIPVGLEHVDGRRWDIEYWQDGQIDQLFEKVDPAVLSGDRAADADLTYPELSLLDKLSYGQLLDGGEWFARRRAQLSSSAFQSILVSHALDHGDHYVEDAIGQLESGDVESAVLSTHRAFRFCVDGLLASFGQWSISSKKWQARMMRESAPPVLPFDRYWAAVTMRDFDPASPERWVRDTLALYQQVQTEISVA